MRHVVAILFGLFILPIVQGMATARAADDGVYVCTQYNTATSTCTAFSPIAEGVSSIQDVGFTPESISLAILTGLALILGIGLLGFAIGAIWKFFDAALGGPL